MCDPTPINLTGSQLEQMTKFIAEQQAQDKSVRLQPAPKLGSGYFELVILDEDGEATAAKRVLFPT
jgi:hypothetical protein